MAIKWLLDKMSAYDNRDAIIADHAAVGYAMLLEHYREWAAIVRNHNFQAGEVILLEGDYSSAACGALLALIENGNIVVPMSAGARHKRREFMEIAQVQKSISFADGLFHIENHSAGPRTGLLKDFQETGHAGLILFTSGTSGAPKAILHDFKLFVERYKTPRETYRTLSFLLFDHIGGINTLFHTLSNGGAIISPSNRSPAEICALIDKHHVELLPASPSFLNLLLMTESDRQYDLSSLKIITYGTEVMPEYTLSQLHRRFPDVQFKQTYGLSELGILRAKSQSSGSSWLKIGGEGVETEVRDETLYIRSRWAMLGYLNAPNPFDDEGWFNTEDQVVVDREYVRILGRRTEIINVGGRKVYPIEVEDVLLQMPELNDVIVKGEPNPIMGNIVTAIVNVGTPASAKDIKTRIREFCRDRLEPFQIPVKVYVESGRLFSNRFKKVRK
ncbi:ANL family adenylate-forming protein [Cohnella cholangitidis]|uniref:Long-chain fatty acid--CoA ligase n=1 Tax=Cohnella cholangitidis TaxID=2598458 RepID=A0A7G5BUH1_9BACL|nr:fatty acid--CoA ligase family protein [Cohnella cholangitidis]QMV40605.1 long-chain fatty acid--CoA ligase [Cohnella cholangitidis]